MRHFRLLKLDLPRVCPEKKRRSLRVWLAATKRRGPLVVFRGRIVNVSGHTVLVFRRHAGRTGPVYIALFQRIRKAKRQILDIR